MSAGFAISEQVFWGTNGAIEAYLGCLHRQARARLGAEHPVTDYFREALEGFFMGVVVKLDPIAEERAEREVLEALFEAATRELLEGDTFSEFGRQWVGSTVQALRARLRE